MLTGAIEILKSLGAAPAEDVPAVADDALPKEPAPMVLVPPSNDFIGPMPAVMRVATTMPAAVTTAVTTAIAAPSPDFVGPMPAVRSTAAVSNNVPNSIMPSLNAAPKTGRLGRVEQLVQHELPKAMMDQAGDTGDDGSVHRRADIQAAVKGMTERAASQNKPTEIQYKPAERCRASASR